MFVESTGGDVQAARAVLQKPERQGDKISLQGGLFVEVIFTQLHRFLPFFVLPLVLMLPAGVGTITRERGWEIRKKGVI